VTPARKKALRASAAALGALLAVAAVGSTLARALGAPPSVVSWTEGARLSLFATVAVIAVALPAGVLLGAAASLGPRWIAGALSRALEIAGALPSVVAAVVVRSLGTPDFAVFVIVLAALRGIETAKVVRASVVGLEAEEFVLAARAMGSGPLRLFRRHLLPHVLGPALASASVAAASVVALDAALSFLGFDSGADTWGAQIALAAERDALGIAIMPLLGLAFLVGALHVVADSLERRVRLRRRFA
jgi:peptide/nickel transport system permease protein